MNQNNELLASYKILSLLEIASDNTEIMLDNMPGVMVVLNQKLRVIRANLEFACLCGCSMESVLGFDFMSLFCQENADIFRRQLLQLKKSTALPPLAQLKSPAPIKTTTVASKAVAFELELTLPEQENSARQFYWQVTQVALTNASVEGDLISISGKDLSELYKSEMKLKNIFSNLPLGMLMVDSAGKIKEVLSQFSEVLFDCNELVGVPFCTLVEGAENFQNKLMVDGLSNLKSCFGRSKSHYISVEKTFPRMIALQSNTKWLDINYQPILKHNCVDGFILLIEDVTEMMQAKKEMERVTELERQIQMVYEAAIRDPLTGLYTRLFMKDSVKTLISNFQLGSIEELSILMMDIDHFKSINDTYGHKVGDNIISEVGRIILKQIRETDVAIRYGGEEFLIILPSKMSKKKLGSVIAERIKKEVENYRLKLENGNEVKVTISGGVAWCGKEENIEQVVERADGFLYQAKRSGRNLIITETGP